MVVLQPPPLMTMPLPPMISVVLVMIPVMPVMLVASVAAAVEDASTVVRRGKLLIPNTERHVLIYLWQP
jgi:hypothetical protein